MGLSFGRNPRHPPLDDVGALLLPWSIGASSLHADLFGHLPPPAENERDELPLPEEQ